MHPADRSVLHNDLGRVFVDRFRSTAMALPAVVKGPYCTTSVQQAAPINAKNSVDQRLVSRAARSGGGAPTPAELAPSVQMKNGAANEISGK
jgi:hypothetical protein